ncbi:hypothetical protein G5B38_08000 [Pseudohalocynthiibacter aestuariivivens]|uniref:Uncharacterized protein n=1 Tax=Roseovarius pelagicus TaxID=2980108 RepID=A0ABY6D912_9RHOB|nr:MULTISPECIES: hypothetical protein [Rhodobacterales]QIE45468.1 hypothetical protein G5B38_08000 [Pseudohalocynthiibacter aestuariivivens]UXX82612.1 hypothetical protein N7U68_16195 [Roseovarius pelagicus]
MADALEPRHLVVDFKGTYASVGGAPPPLHGSNPIADKGPYFPKSLPFAMSIILPLTASIAHFRNSRQDLWGETKNDGRGKHEYRPEFSKK